MSYSPLDGVLLDDPKAPITGAEALLLHLRVARERARRLGQDGPSLEALKARAQACQELLAQGLLPETLEGLQGFGLELGAAGSPHSLRNLIEHLRAYLRAAAADGFLEPDAALWQAVDRQLAGGRGLWIERTWADGPIQAGLQDLQPARLRALACIPELSGALFSLATRKGGERSGLFGGSLPLVAWLLDGLERHGQEFPNEIELQEPEGWGAAPWAGALDGLFEGPLRLGDQAQVLRRALVEGPVDLLRHGVEQICEWLERGLEPGAITVVHPEPQRVAGFLEPLLAREGVQLHVRGGLLPLIDGAAWSPIWMLLTGLHRLDPCAFSAGLRASRRRILRQWADLLASADQDGTAPFEDGIAQLPAAAVAEVRTLWKEMLEWRDATLAAPQWIARIEALAGSLRLPMDSDDFYAPLGLLKEAWRDRALAFPDMLMALRAFLETARSSEVARSPAGLRLVAPGTLLDDWNGSEATLILDLSEGAWPATRAGNPDLDWDRKAAINQALVQASEAGPNPFPPALQRFWLPRSETRDQIPRAFQKEAYAFNKLLAMTRRELVALSPDQDGSGRTRAQGPFWTALEGAGPWAPAADRVASRLRWSWEGRQPEPQAEARAAAAQARGPEAARTAAAPTEDRIDQARARWLRGAEAASPTRLQVLAICPFRSLAEQVMGLGSFDADSRFAMAVGSLAHAILKVALDPYLERRGWPELFLAATGIAAGDDPELLLPHLQTIWAAHGPAWLAEQRELPPERHGLAAQEVQELLPNLAAALVLDARCDVPTREELELLFPGAQAPEGGWTRTILGLESRLGPRNIPMGPGRSLPVQGVLDRLERWDHVTGHSFLRVTDYKTSSKLYFKHYAEGDAPFGAHLQLPLYMLLAELIHEQETTAVLMPLKDEQPRAWAGHLKTLAAEPGEDGWRGRLLRSLGSLDDRLEAGDFPPTPGTACYGCGLGALCGRPVDVETDGEEEGND